MKVSITILVENTTPVAPLIGEYGFSALVTVDEHTILFDTGSNQALFTNSAILGEKIGDADAVVISHGHFDHTGGLVPYLQKYGPKPVFAHPHLFAVRPKPLGKNRERQIGCPYSESQIIEAGGQLTYVDNFFELYQDVYITGEIPRKSVFEDAGGDFKMMVNGSLQEDIIIDDMALIVNHPEGLIIVSGCAHAGIINTISYACEKTGNSKVLAVIGGTHLVGASQERIAKTIDALKKYDPDKVIVSHCTGFYAAAGILHELGDRVVKGETGMQFQF
ncbi:MAG: MBL fold metallo-hydrolase [Syntrophomonadaceae bacterium]|jgi:7,8-dihydropterin-6-yl-methyl-4-(beta-D-ribofuranosyl)aminobenzene 5'-phosphate synthase